jgi:hypothetical protein
MPDRFLAGGGDGGLVPGADEIARYDLPDRWLVVDHEHLAADVIVGFSARHGRLARSGWTKRSTEVNQAALPRWVPPTALPAGSTPAGLAVN